MADYNALRAQTLGSALEEEAVTVNTRALIDKVLARYSSENTTLRELLQNAADANATSVEVRFQSVDGGGGGSALVPPGHQPDFGELVRSKMRRVLVKNDGHSFREEDWQRLKRIAEGNPDETKIGAFGVGFYSVFADCEEPFVSSGDQAMAFYWKGNSLFTRRARLGTNDPYTTFLLEYREPSELPDLRELCKFFATSLTFVRLNSISLYVDDHCLLSLQKKASPSDLLQIPESINPVTKDKTMRIARVDTERVQIDAKFMNVTHYRSPASEIGQSIRSIFSRFSSQPVVGEKSSQSDLSAYKTATIFLRIATATVNTNISSAFAKELERATKKLPPKTTKLAILSMSKDELDASEHKAEIFSNVLPGRSGRVFIGFPTHQTTSISAHISAPSVIPTVERENIDLNARVVRDWNIEMLRIAGILARIMYTDEMSILARRAEGLKEQYIGELFDHAIHIMKQFTFTSSTPASAVGRYIENEFWGSGKRFASIEVLSTKGVLPSDRVRLSSDVNFLVGLPLLPEKIAEEASEFVRSLKEMGLLTEVTIADIRQELGDKALSGEQLEFFLKWLADKRFKGDLDEIGVKSMLDVAVATTSLPGAAEGDATVPISLGIVRFFVNPAKMTPDVPIPPDCLPFHVTKGLARHRLAALGWDEIGITHWLTFVCSQTHLPASQNIELSPKFSAQVLAIVSRNWDQISPDQRDGIVSILKNKKCIPTKVGLRIPTEAYFNTVKLFQDLPLILSMNGVRDKLLVALGVRKTVELKLVFERLMGENKVEGGTKWSHVDLIRYLTSVSSDIPRDDITKLKNMAICKAETTGHQSQNLYKVSGLYEPDDHLRKLKLPILQWPNWRPGSLEAKFLTSLGLKKFPNAEDVLKIAAYNLNDVKLREAALEFYVNNYHTNGYSSYNAAGFDMPFLPLEAGHQEKARLAVPRQCYSNPRASIMGFDVLRRDLQQHGAKFGVTVDPPMVVCVEKLMNQPPATIRAAQEKFSYFSTRLAEILPHLVERLSIARIVPVMLKDSDIRPGLTKKTKWIPPRNCFLGDQGSLYYEIFDFVDFGQDANAFLLKCGSKHEPTVSEVAYMIVREPNRLLDVFGGEKKYLGVLRSLAENLGHLRKDRTLVKEMRRSQFLGAYREISAGDGADAGGVDGDADGGVIKVFVLDKADQILVIDDYVTYVMFKHEILTAPQEDILESFYMFLGASDLSKKVTPEWRIGNNIPAVKEAEKLSKLVLERCRLFLHNSTEEVAHDARWLENNLRVSYVDAICVRNTLKHDGHKSVSHQQAKTAAITRDPTTKHTILFVTRKFSCYDVSVGLASIILKRPRPHLSLLLESLLSTDLMVLKERGFNVDRILRAKAAEARIAEAQRQKKHEEDRRRIEEEKLAREKEKQLIQEQEKQPTMPGSFAESPNGKAPTLVPSIVDRPKVNNFFGKISKTLGFDKDTPQAEQIKNLIEYQSPERQQGQSVMGPSPHVQPQVGKPTEPHMIRENLRKAVESSRSHDSDSVFSPPQAFDVKEQKSYCDSRPSHDIIYLGNSSLGIKLYIDKGVQDQQGFVSKNLVAANSFSSLLKDIAEIYLLSLASLHIYYDEQGTTIAFNTNGSIFCNLRFFLQLHAEAVAKGSTEQALIYWFVVAAHELAHNLVPDHSAQHSFYAETFVQEYFVGAMKAIQKRKLPSD